MHAANLVVTVVWIYYFDASITSPFGTRTVPMLLVVPVLIGLSAGVPLPRHDSSLTRQTLGLSSGRIAAVRLGLSGSLWVVGSIALMATTANWRALGLPLVAYAVVIASATVLGQLYWVPVGLAFVALLPWLLTDEGMTSALSVAWSGRTSVIGMSLVLLASCAYVLMDRSDRRLHQPLRAE